MMTFSKILHSNRAVMPGLSPLPSGLTIRGRQIPIFISFEGSKETKQRKILHELTRSVAVECYDFKCCFLSFHRYCPSWRCGSSARSNRIRACLGWLRHGVYGITFRLCSPIHAVYSVSINLTLCFYSAINNSDGNGLIPASKPEYNRY